MAIKPISRRASTGARRFGARNPKLTRRANQLKSARRFKSSNRFRQNNSALVARANQLKSARMKSPNSDLAASMNVVPAARNMKRISPPPSMGKPKGGLGRLLGRRGKFSRYNQVASFSSPFRYSRYSRFTS